MTRALLISRFFPFNAEKVHGIYQRLGTQIEALARVADRIDCLFLVPVDQDCSAEAVREHQERLRRLWSPAIDLTLAPTLRYDAPQGRWQRVVEGIFDFQRQLIARPTCTAGAVEAVSAALDSRPDLVLVHRLDAMGVLMRLSRGTPQKLRGVPLFFDLDDIEHVAKARHLLHDPAWPAQRLLLLQLPALLLAELRAVRLATATFVCSQSDRRYLARLSAGARVCTVPNSVTFPPLSATDSSEPLVLFVGAMSYRPNAQAADSLVEEIWPPLHARVPAARLAIIWTGPRARPFIPQARPDRHIHRFRRGPAVLVPPRAGGVLPDLSRRRYAHKDHRGRGPGQGDRVDAPRRRGAHLRGRARDSAARLGGRDRRCLCAPARGPRGRAAARASGAAEGERHLRARRRRQAA